MVMVMMIRLSSRDGVDKGEDSHPSQIQYQYNSSTVSYHSKKQEDEHNISIRCVDTYSGTRTEFYMVFRLFSAWLSWLSLCNGTHVCLTSSSRISMIHSIRYATHERRGSVTAS